MKTRPTITRKVALPGIQHRFFSAMRLARQAREDARRQREAVEQLGKMTDRELKDIGIRRDDIYSEVFGAGAKSGP